MEFCEHYGRLRCNAKQPHIRQQDSGYHDSQDRALPHIIGLRGELAYSLITHKPIDTRIFSHGDDTDFDGVEIKSSTWPHPDIEIKIKQKEYFKKTPKHYVLSRVVNNNVTFIGCIRRLRFDYTKYSKSHGHQLNFCVNASELARFLPVYSNNKLSIIPL